MVLNITISCALSRLTKLQSSFRILYYSILQFKMSSTSADESWKTQPPYHIQSPESFGTVHWTASCQCGRVTYKINREKPLDAKYCHCRTCQVLHGSYLASPTYIYPYTPFSPTYLLLPKQTPQAPPSNGPPYSQNPA